MFKFFSKKQEDKSPAEVKLEQIRDILFPPCDEHVDKDGQKYHIDYSADLNLDAAFIDLEEGYNDPASRATIKKVSERIYQVRKILDEFRDMKEAKYFIVDDLSEDTHEKIQAQSGQY